jgi:hypothetical protein
VSYLKIVNPYILRDLLSPITGRGDEDEVVEKYKLVDFSDETQYKVIINDLFVDYFQTLSKEKKAKAKLALSYYLSRSEFDFERVFESCLPPFDPPRNVRDFFVWIWEALFNKENYNIDPNEVYKIVADVHEPNRPAKKGDLVDR